MQPKSPEIVLPNAPLPPVFGEPATNRPQRKPSTPSYLGAGTVPSNPQQGMKTLLGQ